MEHHFKILLSDSLIGYGVTGSPAYIIKTTNGGDNWLINYSHSQPFYRIHFINKDTGYVLSLNQFLRTYDQGDTWTIITLPPDLFASDMFVLNKDTMWAADSESLTGGLFRTTNGGINWIRQTSEKQLSVNGMIRRGGECDRILNTLNILNELN